MTDANQSDAVVGRLVDPWLAATRLSIDEARIVNHAMYNRWRAQVPDKAPPLEAANLGWSDLFAAGLIALEKHRDGAGGGKG